MVITLLSLDSDLQSRWDNLCTCFEINFLDMQEVSVVYPSVDGT